MEEFEELVKNQAASEQDAGRNGPDHPVPEDRHTGADTAIVDPHIAVEVSEDARR